MNPRANDSNAPLSFSGSTLKHYPPLAAPDHHGEWGVLHWIYSASWRQGPLLDTVPSKNARHILRRLHRPRLSPFGQARRTCHCLAVIPLHGKPYRRTVQDVRLVE